MADPARGKDPLTWVHQMVTVAAIPFVLGVTGYFAVQFDGLRLTAVKLETQLAGLAREVEELERRIDRRAAGEGHTEQWASVPGPSLQSPCPTRLASGACDPLAALPPRGSDAK